MKIILYGILVLYGLSNMCRSQVVTARQAEQTRLLDQLLDKYDPRIHPVEPNGTDAPVEVTLGVDLLAVTDISEYDQEFTVLIRLVQEWKDARLMYKSKEDISSLILTDPKKVWTPDLYFVNEKDADLHQLMAPNRLLSILPSGMVHYSSRVSLSLWCQMKLERFPFDSQICNIQMESYAYKSDNLRLIWRAGNPVTLPSNRQVDVIGFTLVDAKTFSTENDQTTEVRLLFRRDLQYYTLHTFLPSAALVALSWLSFCMDRHAVVARLFIILFAISSMFLLTADVEATVPHVPYLKAVDLWTGGCFLFLVAALLELFLVHTVMVADDRRVDGSPSLGMKPLVGKSLPSRHEAELTSMGSPSSYLGLPRDPEHIEHVTRTIIPGLFGVFAASYFVIQCVLSDNLTL